MRVLTIDLDYITTDYSRFLDTNYSKYPALRWDKLMYNSPLISRDFKVDCDNLLYSIDVFSRAIEQCQNVVVGIDHESILYELDSIDDEIDLVNIDQHHDIAYDKDQIYKIEKHNIVSEGAWIWYLYIRNRISSYKWICTETSVPYNRKFVSSPPKPGVTVDTESKHLPEIGFPFVYGTKDKIGELTDLEFDLIYVAESPHYVYPDHWRYIDFFRIVYRNKYGYFPKQITQKYEWDYSKQLNSWSGHLG